MLPVVRTEQAETDLADILGGLDERNPRTAERLAAAIDARCNFLGQFPQAGRTREELAPGLRSIVIDHYIVFYRVTPSSVEVLRVLHGARDIDTIMKPD